MQSSEAAPVLEVQDLDMISELRFRCWARENYVTAEARDPNWHPVVLDEMQRKDQELDVVEASKA